jgi:hypothetical protein
MANHQIKIFISSTSTDLSEIRSEIAKRLSEVFGAELIIMETFGSDATPPDILSVRRVRECNIFVGVYAHRYGTIDQMSGKSITELELDEAKIALSSGTLTDILLYPIDNNVSWPDDLKESGETAKAGLHRIKQKARQHTYDSFMRKEDLLFKIIRDVHRRLKESFGAYPLKVRPSILRPTKRILQPLGMEFLTSEYRDYLAGREKETYRLIELIENYPIILLLGESGVGKTSLIHAGLIPKATANGWRIIYTRPFGFPFTDIIYQIQTTIFEGRPSYKGPLLSLLGEIVGAIEEGRLLLIIDQFEDILVSRDYSEVEKIISELGILRQLSTDSMRVLISYRADLEGRLGSLWQIISGSPQGLPRQYLNGISEDKAWESIIRVVKDLSIKINLHETEQKLIKEELFAACQTAGFSSIYPPYIQMFIDHVWLASKKEAGTYFFRDYQAVGGMGGVIGGYLSRQLEYAQDVEGHIRLVLVSLVRSYGVKAQKTIDEISIDTGLDKHICEMSLEKLIDLRLVRHIGTYYEITHDFIARKIISELVDSEEKEFKRFCELLSTKGAAYQTTEAPLTCEELLMLYKHKERVIPNELELRLILFSWVKGVGPGLYWILKEDNSKILELLREVDIKEDIDRDEKVSIILLRKIINKKPLTNEDFAAFRSYQLSAELTALILEASLSLPNELVMYGIRHRRIEVREACIQVIALKIINGDWSLVAKLRNSNSIHCRHAYETLVIRDDIPIPTEVNYEKRIINEFTILKRIKVAKSSTEVKSLIKVLESSRPPRKIMLFGEALGYIKTSHINSLLRKAQRVSKEKADILFGAISGKVALGDFEKMLAQYKLLNLREKGRYETRSVFLKAEALANAIFRSTSYECLPQLLKTMQSIKLTASSRGIVLALLSYGNMEDFKLVLSRIEAAEYEISYWNHTELGRAIAKQMANIVKGIPKYLLDIMEKKEFWEYISGEDRKGMQKSSLLEVKNLFNRALFIRLTGYAMIGAANYENEEHLKELAVHGYGLIARAAAIRLVQLLGEDAIRKLNTKIDDSIQKGKSDSLAYALRYAEIEFYGVASLW